MRTKAFAAGGGFFGAAGVARALRGT